MTFNTCLLVSLFDCVSAHCVCIFVSVLLLSFVDKYESMHRHLIVPHWALPPIVRVPALLKSFLSKYYSLSSHCTSLFLLRVPFTFLSAYVFCFFFISFCRLPPCLCSLEYARHHMILNSLKFLSGFSCYMCSFFLVMSFTAKHFLTLFRPLNTNVFLTATVRNFV